MGRSDYYAPGQWNAICDECGQKFKSSQLMKRWDGLMVCEQDWNIRQPQDFVRGIPDPQATPWSRPQGGLLFRHEIRDFIYDTNDDIILDTNNRPISQVP